MPSRTKSRLILDCGFLLFISSVWVGCTTDSPMNPNAAGGATQPGSSAQGGSSSANQGGTVVGSGGIATGGSIATGGVASTVPDSGGATGSGGKASGGVAGSGGATPGDAPGSGGTSAPGGKVSGDTSTPGGKVSGGTLGSGGTGLGGAPAMGGTVPTGGKGSGGAPGSGGTGLGDASAGPGPDAGTSPGRDASTADYPPSTGTPTVYIAGDSTVSTYTTAQAPQEGWGQRIQEFFTSDVVIVNKAIGGESSKSFVDEGHLAEILAVIKPGDYLFAQWGINDRSVAGPARATDPATTFRTYLKQYIDGARGKNAIPVLITPTPRLQYNNGVFENGFADYCTAIKAVGTETNTAVIDLQSKGLAYYTTLGYATVSTTISLNKGTPDPLHFQAQGAYEMARLVAQGVVEINLPISQYVIQSKLQEH